MVDGFGMRNPLQYGLTKRPSATQFLQAADQPATGGALNPLRLMQLRQSVIEQQMRPERTAAQQMMAMPTRMKPTPAVKPPSLSDRVSGMMPAAGTPQAAGLGAAGAKMLQLSGYSDRPIAMSQILGEAAQAYTTAKKETAAEQAATLQAQQELERQRKKDALEAENIRSQIAEREKPKAPSLTSIFDPETGREAKGYFNDSGRFIRVGGVKAEDKKTGKPSGFVAVYDKQGNFVKNVREGSTEADQFANKGFRIIESTQLTGGKGDVGITTSVKGKIQTDIKDLEQARSGLVNIKESFDPSMQTFATRSEAYILGILEKGGVGLSRDDEKLISDVSAYKQNAWDAANRYIKYLTGAQMSKAEAQRILKSFPDPRLGLFEGDSPTEFKRKLDDAIAQVEASLSRNYYFLNKGFDIQLDTSADPEKGEDNVIYVDDRGRKIDLGDMDYLRDKEARQISKKYEAPEYDNMSDDQKLDAIEAEVEALFSSVIGA